MHATHTFDELHKGVDPLHCELSLHVGHAPHTPDVQQGVFVSEHDPDFAEHFAAQTPPTQYGAAVVQSLLVVHGVGVGFDPAFEPEPDAPSATTMMTMTTTIARPIPMLLLEAIECLL